MKKSLLVLLSAALLILVLAGCASDDGRTTIQVYNWGDYIADGVIDQFEEETGIRVVYSMYETNEDMYTKIKSSDSAGYDVIFPSDYIIQKLIGEGLLAELDYNNIPNMALIDERYKDLAFDPGNKHSVPYMWGTLGIVYNETMVSEPVDSWGALWDPAYTRNIFMLDSMRDSIGLTLKYLGYSMNTRSMDELNAARNKLIEQKPLVLAYVGDQVKDQMIAGEAAMAVVYSGDAITIMDQNEDIHYVVPKEGSNLWFDNMCVLRSSKNKEAAEQFINFMTRTDIAEKNRDYINFSTPQREVYEALPDEIKADPAQYPADEVFERCQVFEDLGDMTRIYDEYWTQISASN